jgi:large-conductance mechanosensitive channel
MILAIINFILLSLLIGIIVYLYNIDKQLIKNDQNNQKNIQNIATTIHTNNQILDTALISKK